MVFKHGEESLTRLPSVPYRAVNNNFFGSVPVGQTPGGKAHLQGLRSPLDQREDQHLQVSGCGPAAALGIAVVPVGAQGGAACLGRKLIRAQHAGTSFSRYF